jgi:hypothetical protein
VGWSYSNEQLSWYDEMHGMKKTSKWVWGAVGLAAILLLLASGSCDTFLLDAGKFMAPVDDRMDGAADIVVLEGIDHIERELLARAAGMVSSGKARRLIVVLTRRAAGETPSANPEAPLLVVQQALGDLGQDETLCKIVWAPFQHPATLTSAKTAMEVLAEEGVRSVILISPGFHARRSYLVYQSLGEPLQIRIHPHASFDGHNHGLDRWWTQYHGVHDFVEQGLKLAYYMVRGYIPLRFSY